MKKWKKNDKAKKNEKIVKMKKFGFTRKILDDFHDFISECVSFPKKINNPFWGLTVFSKEKWQFSLDVKHKLIYYWRKINEKIAKVSPSNNNYSIGVINHSTTKIQFWEAPF